MLPWYQREGVRIAAIAVAAGLLLGGLIALAMSRPELSSFGKPQKSTADAIASDQAAEKPREAEAKAKPKAEPARRAAARTGDVAAVVRAGTADASDRRAGRTRRGDRAPRRSASRPGVAPRRQSTSRRVTAPRSPVRSPAPRRRSTSPRPAPSQPSPSAPQTQTQAPAPTAAPAPVAQATPAPTAQGRPDHAGPRPDRPGHGNGHGGDDDAPDDE